MTKRSKEEIVISLDDTTGYKSIKRIDEYITIDTKITFLCLVCDYEWETAPAHILYADSGCPVCSKNIKLTDDDVDIRLEKRNIKRIGHYIDSTTKIKFQCEICEHIWDGIPANVMRKTGCPKCAGLEKLSNEQIDKKLVGRNIIRLGDYDGNKTPLKVKCMICDYVWDVKTNNLFSNNSGCPDCAGLAPLSNAEIDKRLEGRNIQRVDDYKNNHTIMLFRCLVKECQYEWKTTSKSILVNGAGCPSCNLCKNQKLVGTILTENGITFEQEKHIKEIFEEISNKDRKSIDFYIQRSKTIVEYNGIQHYQPTRFGGMSEDMAINRFAIQKERDELLQKLCSNNNIHLIWIDGRMYKEDKLKQYMIDVVIPEIIAKKE